MSPGILGGSIILCPSGEAVPGVEVALTGDSQRVLTTDCSGRYEFLVDPQGRYSVTPTKHSPASEGVSILDIVLIRQHILTSRRFAEPCQVIAADVDGSTTVSALDIVRIREVILALTTTFPAGSWKFMAADFVPIDPLSPWPFPQSRDYFEPASDRLVEDYVGIKLGDVDGSWNNHCPSQIATLAHHPAGAAASVIPGVRFGVQQTQACSNTVTASLVVSGFDDVTGMQFTLHWDPAALEFRSLSSFGLEGLDLPHFNTNLIAEGKLPLAWDDPRGAGVSVPNGTAVFTVEFARLDSKCSLVQLGDTPTLREVVQGANAVGFETIPA